MSTVAAAAAGGFAQHPLRHAPGCVRAVQDVSFTLQRGQVLGLVGESGSGKSITGLSLMGLVDPPGRQVGGRIVFDGQDLSGCGEEQWRQLRGRRIAMIFQDPMATLNPVLRIDTQMIEAIQAHEPVSHSAARTRCREALVRVGIAAPDERLAAYPQEFQAACASAWPSPSPCSTGPI